MQDMISEICDVINADEAMDVNGKIAALGAVFEAILKTEVVPTFHAQAIDNFTHLLRRRVGVTIN